MNLKLSHCFITVADRDDALAFHRDLLGPEVRADVAIGSMSWLTVASPSQPGGIEISLETPEGRPGDTDALSAVVAAGSLTGAIVQIDECGADSGCLAAGPPDGPKEITW